MAIKYYFNDKKKETIAVLSGCKYDVEKAIAKMVGDKFNFCVFGLKYMLVERLLPGMFKKSKYLIPDTFKASVKCSDEDEFDREIGKKLAKANVMERYYASFDSKMEEFKNDAADFADTVFGVDRMSGNI